MRLAVEQAVGVAKRLLQWVLRNGELLRGREAPQA
jgi:hypothetical protein